MSKAIENAVAYGILIFTTCVAVIPVLLIILEIVTVLNHGQLRHDLFPIYSACATSLCAFLTFVYKGRGAVDGKVLDRILGRKPVDVVIEPAKPSPEPKASESLEKTTPDGVISVKNVRKEPDKVPAGDR